MSESPKNTLRKEDKDSISDYAVPDGSLGDKKPFLPESSMESQIQASSSFLPDNGSQMSRDVDLWINGSNPHAPVNTGVQRSRLPVHQRSTFTTGDSTSAGGRFLYMLTLLIPLIKTHQRALWSRSTGALMTSLEPVFTQIGRIFNMIHGELRRFTAEHVIQESITTALDVILVVYAIGFLFIALYQSANIA